MAVVHGKRGAFTFTGIAIGGATSFTVDATADVADATIMDASAVAADKHWKDYTAGFKDWTATLEGLEVDTGPGTVGTFLGSEQTLTLDTTTGLSYAGTAICTGYSINCSKDGTVSITATFQGTGTLAAS